MRRQQSGFTIIELVVVVILLGILAAVALPRFMNVDDQARDAAVSGIQGSLQTGISLYYAQWVAEGRLPAGTQIEPFADLRVNATGFPYGADSNTANVVSTSADCSAVWSGVLQVGAPSVATAADLAGVAAAGANVDVVAVRDGTACDYYYTAWTTTTGAVIPRLTYNSVNGLITRGTATLP
jgi:MSHA pilin protein MshB